MSLYGALFAGVAGLNAQSNTLGIISDNIANVNTVGYKASGGTFESLVTNSGSNTAYSPGGVLGGNAQQIDKQGLLTTTSSPTDIAISGAGFFVVNHSSDGTGQVLYTRAGSFTQDSTGNFKNAAGLFLQAWPLNRNGQLPGEVGNLDTKSSANLSSLQTVNVQNLTGTAASTTSVSIGANLRSSETAYLGAGGKVTMDKTDPLNNGINATAIIAPSAVDGMQSGDKFTVATGQGLTYTYTYGGFTYGRDVTSGAPGGDAVPLLHSPTTLGTDISLNSATSLTTTTNLSNSSFTTTIGTNTVTVTQPSHGLETGDTVTIANVTADLGNVLHGVINGSFAITVVDANHYTITVGGPAATTSATGGNAGVTSTVVPFQTVSAGSGDVIVNQPSSGLEVGDTVTFAGSTATFDNITTGNINGHPFPITQIIDANHYKISTAGSASIGGKAGGTGSITATIIPFKEGASGTRDLTLTQPANNLAVGDYVTLAGMTPGTSFGDIHDTDINNQTFKVKAIVDANHFTIDSGVTVTGPNVGATGGAGSITASAFPFSVGANSNVVTVYQPAHGLKTGDVVTLSGNNGDVGTIPAADLNGTFVVTVTDANHYTLTTVDPSTTAAGGGTGIISATTRPYGGQILDATNVNQPFLGVTGTSGVTSAALKFTITTATTGTVTFSYTTTSPNAQLGQFNNLSNLATAISDVNGLSARVVNNRLYVGATDADEALTITNGQDTGTAGPPIQSGIDWKNELGLSDILGGTNRFSSMQGLADIVNNSAGLSATVENPLSLADVKINVKDPLDTITFRDKTIAAPLAALATPTPFTTAIGSKVVTVTQAAPTGFVTGDIVHLNATHLPGTGPFKGIPKDDFTGDFVVTVISPTSYSITVAHPALSAGLTGDTGLVVTPPNNQGSVLATLGLTATLSGAAFTTPASTGALGPAYDPTNGAKNMASGAIPAQFSKPVTVYDALGTGHTLNVGFLKTLSNTWAIEIYATPATDVSSSLANGQIAFGNVTFNGDGSLLSVSSSLSQALPVQWSNGATPSSISFNWGTQGQPFGTPNAQNIGKTDGLSQFNSAFSVNFVNQNGAPVGSLTGVSIDQSGFIIASYNNGETQKLFKIPLAEFTDPDQLQTVSGNAYVQTSASGEVNLRQPGTNGVGAISSASLEASNVELADQLTEMIVAQRAYQANTKVISTADQLLQALDQIIQ